jgi:hypothetical protein
MKSEVVYSEFPTKTDLVCVVVDVDGITFEGYALTKKDAKKKAAEEALKSVFNIICVEGKNLFNIICVEGKNLFNIICVEGKNLFNISCVEGKNLFNVICVEGKNLYNIICVEGKNIFNSICVEGLLVLFDYLLFYVPLKNFSLTH